jgi:hypothetical protein
MSWEYPIQGIDQSQSIKSVNTDFTSFIGNNVVLVDGSSAGCTQSLPPCSTMQGLEITYIRVDDNPDNVVGLVASLPDTILTPRGIVNGLALIAQGQSVRLLGIGKNLWYCASPTPRIEQSERWLNQYHQGYGTGNITGAAGKCFLTLMRAPTRIRLSEMDVRWVTNGGAATKARFGLYSDSGLTPAGGTLLWDSGDIAADSGAGAPKVATINPKVTVPKGWFWACVETADATVQFMRITNLAVHADQTGEFSLGCSFTQTYGALPANCPAVTNSGNDLANCFLVGLLVDKILGGYD